jgi:hypothetical protein
VSNRGGTVKSKPSYSGHKSDPRQPATRIRLAAEYLRDTARQYLSDRALAAEVDQAVAEWSAARAELSNRGAA